MQSTNFLHLTIELIVGFFALLVITKILGKTQINQLTPFDFISALVLGELVGNAIYDNEIGLHYVLYAIVLWAILISTIEKVTQKKKGTRSLLEGKPAIVIREGQLDYEAMKKNKLDLNQLQHLLRDRDVFSIQDVHYAILEANGTINVLKTAAASTPKNKEWLPELPAEPALPFSIILDGEWVEDNLTEANVSKKQILQHLQSRNIPDINRVLYAEWDGAFPLYIQTYNDKP
ncbi:Uncharacterized membrane protein YcaP, DUF421 family [Alteribacillus persepolensis]|uniref:Uncharacterized membrane protein YcaP, DUF421 family n=1 Tax=Alteribacillus persepolensis TaxID=568899 RepID=A0A1G7ZM75_9BACI|nr:DUF421 domain-containing protein [Alteribacillus persepolensis]SDH09852.1 Uncharacterized membrane protein YcaP, DUF421 family [Alteribacillus persepolensis]